MNWAYAAALGFSLLGMAILDFRHGLFWGAALRNKSARTWARTAAVHFGVWGVFLLWDVLGIGLGVFFRGDSPYMTGIDVAPHLPVEELLFLFFLVWLTTNVFAGTAKLAEWRAGRGAGSATRQGAPRGATREAAGHRAGREAGQP
ncbi:lycopene cyclase domain-containing protein [Brevibacterium sp. HMSC063G07]|uniref:lycopene cyclase domain-containing protein n=1 Tax=Brevibacterium sp. HMSC063G07 TaxID=1739261 RepID=UPI0008A5D6B0|nr:lycopene cyclase domain-containing protein [Brevibacterium sp. HMSC063G07]